MTLRHDRPSRGNLWFALVCLAGISLSCLAALAQGEPRTWSDISGKFSREAVFLKLEEGQVHLRLKSGKETKIPLKELSKKDRDWVRANAAAAAPAKPIGSRIVIRSYKAIVDDSVFLAEALKQQALAGAVPGLFVALTGGKPLDGFDISKPIVITVHVDPQGQPAGTLVAVPVLGKERFQKTLDTVFPVKTTPAGRGHEIAMLGKSVYAKPGTGYFLLSDDPNLVRNAAADPPAPVVVSDVAVESYNGALSPEVREAALAQFEAMLAAAPIPGNLPPVGEPSRQETLKVIRSLVRSLAIDADRSTFEASIDPTTKGASLASSVRARSGTPLAESLAAYGAIRPRFATPGGDVGLGWAGVSLPANDWVRMALEGTLGEGIVGMKTALARLEGRPEHGETAAALAELEKELRRLMAIGHFEQEIAFGVDEAGAPRLVTRIAFAEARGLVGAFGKLLAVGAPPGTIAPNADGILTLPPEVGAAPPGPLGKQPVRIGASDTALVVGFGCADTDPLKAMLAATPAGSESAPVSLRVDLAKLWPVLATANPATASLGEVVGPAGMLRAEVSPLSDGIELRINADAGVLRLLGALGAAAAQAQGVAGGPGIPGAPGFPAPGGPPAGLLPPSIQGFPVPPVTPPQAPAP